MLGSEKHLLVEPDGFRSLDKVPQGVWLLSHRFRNSGNPCLGSLLTLGGVDVPSVPDDAWRKVMATLGSTDPVPWSSVLPPSFYKKRVKNILKTVVGNFDRLPKEYCAQTWMPCGSVLDALRPARVDSSQFRSLSDAGVGNGALESFRPGAGGYAPVVAYDRFGTRTGRLTVASGPNILTLKKEHRSVLRSHYSDGRVVSLDFSSLEARIILCEAGASAPASDIYGHIAQEIFGGSASRSAVKVAVLAELYGASKGLLSRKLEMTGPQLDRMVDGIRSYFKTDELKKRLAHDLRTTGYIHNK